MINHLKQIVLFWTKHYEEGYYDSDFLNLWVILWFFILLVVTVGLLLSEVSIITFVGLSYIAAAFPLLCQKAAAWAKEDDDV